MPPRADRRTAENEVCNAVISNTRHDISSHISRQHEELAHYQDTKKDPNNPWVCPCGDVSWDKWVNYLSHLSRQHEERAHYRDTKKDPNNPWVCPCGDVPRRESHPTLSTLFPDSVGNPPPRCPMTSLWDPSRHSLWLRLRPPSYNPSERTDGIGRTGCRHRR
ncbi:hypothetical protein PG991_013076 [Apiospora marii]|uniref:Uncharacterized protein n=1 Tax=Apiospora marii TaxID=335849 RepID=A0ABR1R6U1_9PEZI